MAVNTANVHVLSYSATTVTTGAYTLLFTLSATAPLQSCAKLLITDTSGKVLKLAASSTSVDGSQVDFCSVPVSGTLLLPIYLAPGTSVWIKAIDANATTGYNVVSLLG